MLKLTTCSTRRKLSLLLLSVLLGAGAGGCGISDARLWSRSDKLGLYAVDSNMGIAYPPGHEVQHSKQELDVFSPVGKKDCPVVVLVHGGGWIMGDNRCFGLYSSIGEYLASQGIVAVLPNYRLSPLAGHPDHIEDIAKAVAWTHEHIGEYGGRNDQIFLVGHSAGGHLVSLLTTDERYLKAEKLSSNIIKGVVSISGVYEIPPDSISFELGGNAGNAVRVDKMLPLRESSTVSAGSFPGIPMSFNLFGLAFGNDAKTRKDASPITHVRKDLPPFLLMNADNDLPLLPKMTEKFHQSLLTHGCQSKSVIIPSRNHNSIIFQAYQPDDPVAKAIVQFIKSHTLAASFVR